MTEDYLQHTWLFLNFDTSNLLTTHSEKIEIIEKGTLNTNAGPDFLHAKIKIGNEIWVGHVEIHVQSSFWELHNHQLDDAYNNVILHVVLNDDKPVLNKNGESIPTLELKGKLYDDHYEKYREYISLLKLFPCESEISNVDSIKIHSWINRIAIQRLNRKVIEIDEVLSDFKGDWNQLLFYMLCRVFGSTVNKKSMEQLASLTPLRIISKESFSLFSLEALLFGQAGMLAFTQDDYQKELADEYFYLHQKYKLQNMSPVEWKFSRMRPTNFPTLRIAQLAAVYNQRDNFFTLIRDKEPQSIIEEVFRAEVSEYWKNHYRFGKKSLKIAGRIGNMFLENIIINAIIPVAFAYGKYLDDESYIDYALEILQKIKFEENKKTKFWKDKQGVPLNALGSQGVIELVDKFCQNKKCLSCAIGVDILKN